MGGNATDGCVEFMPSGEQGSIEALNCSACRCHRNFHRKEIEGEIDEENYPHHHNTPFTFNFNRSNNISCCSTCNSTTIFISKTVAAPHGVVHETPNFFQLLTTIPFVSLLPNFKNFQFVTLNPFFDYEILHNKYIKQCQQHKKIHSKPNPREKHKTCSQRETQTQVKINSHNNIITSSSAALVPQSQNPSVNGTTTNSTGVELDLDQSSYKKPLSQVVVKYRECLKNHAAAMGGNATDGCVEFMPSGEQGSIEALNCSACRCHRNFHRKEIEGEIDEENYPHHHNTPFTFNFNRSNNISCCSTCNSTTIFIVNGPTSPFPNVPINTDEPPSFNLHTTTHKPHTLSIPPISPICSTC
ncbi:hypothetical protein RYX36_015612 [Vicia faba]